MLADDEVEDPPVLERRRVERRQEGGTAGPRRGTRVLPASFQEGWLVFEADDGDDTRRLAPIPDDWESCDDATLDRYLNHAHGVTRRTA